MPVEVPVISAVLKDRDLKSLVKLAKKCGLAGWKSMRKEQLVKALSRTRKPQAKLKPRIKAKVVARALRNGSKKNKLAARPHVNGKIRPAPKNGRVHLNGNANGKAISHKPVKNTRATQKIQKAHAHRENTGHHQ